MKPTGTIALAALVGGVALAQAPDLDADGDGTITLQEYQDAQAARAAERFRRLDANADGMLTQEELRATRRDGRGRDGVGRDFARLDSDDDGNLSLAELQARNPTADQALFGALDTNANGLVTPEEWRAGRDALRSWRQAQIAAIDSNADGAWSLAELQAVRPNLDPERFARMDRNGDGLVSADERGRRGRDDD